MIRVLITILCLCFVAAGPAQQRKPDFLDLTKTPPQKMRPYRKGGGAGAGGGDGWKAPPKIIPVKVTLLSLDKRSYQLGDEVIYEVVLENTTKDVLVIPWSGDYDKVKPDEERGPPSYIYAFLGLVIKGEIGGDQSIAGQEIFGVGQGIHGSQLLRGSLKSLSPGQKVRIRAAGRWSVSSTDEASRRLLAKLVLAKLPHTFEVSAQFRLTETQINSRYEPAISANSLTVELRRGNNDVRRVK